MTGFQIVLLRPSTNHSREAVWHSQKHIRAAGFRPLSSEQTLSDQRPENVWSVRPQASSTDPRPAPLTQSGVTQGHLQGVKIHETLFSQNQAQILSLFGEAAAGDSTRKRQVRKTRWRPHANLQRKTASESNVAGNKSFKSAQRLSQHVRSASRIKESPLKVNPAALTSYRTEQR